MQGWAAGSRMLYYFHFPHSTRISNGICASAASAAVISVISTSVSANIRLSFMQILRLRNAEFCKQRHNTLIHQLDALPSRFGIHIHAHPRAALLPEINPQHPFIFRIRTRFADIEIARRHRHGGICIIL